MSAMSLSPFDSTLKVSDPAKQVATVLDDGFVVPTLNTGDGCVAVGDGCIADVTIGDGCIAEGTVVDGCVTVGDGCASEGDGWYGCVLGVGTVVDGCVTVGTVGDGCVTVGDGCVTVGTVGDGCVTVGTVGDGCVTLGDGCVTVGDGWYGCVLRVGVLAGFDDDVAFIVVSDDVCNPDAPFRVGIKLAGIVGVRLFKLSREENVLYTLQIFSASEVLFSRYWPVQVGVL
jgi:hypothetical protein